MQWKNKLRTSSHVLLAWEWSVDSACGGHRLPASLWSFLLNEKERLVLQIPWQWWFFVVVILMMWLFTLPSWFSLPVMWSASQGEERSPNKWKLALDGSSSYQILSPFSPTKKEEVTDFSSDSALSSSIFAGEKKDRLIKKQTVRQTSFYPTFTKPKFHLPSTQCIAAQLAAQPRAEARN